VIHGLKTRTWRYTHTAAAALAIGAAAAGHLKDNVPGHRKPPTANDLTCAGDLAGIRNSGPGQAGTTGRQLIHDRGLPFRAAVRKLRD
jgi:hypothetical protein